VNPNTSAPVTALLEAAAWAAAPGPAARVRALTAPFGAPYIADEAAAAVAGHALLAALAADERRHGPPSAVLVGCFGDPGLFAARACCGAPVRGLAEAAMAAAATHGRFAIVTGGLAWPPMLERLAHATGHAAALAGIEAVPESGAELLADPAAGAEVLAAACRRARQRFAPDALLLGGAALAPFAAALRERVPLPLVESVQAGVAAAWRDATTPFSRGPAPPGRWPAWLRSE
jgi:Asp/Glu/hydantoin racemase